MNATSIEWVKNPDGTQGYTWNPITGCLNHVDGMCKGGNFPCYAYRLAHTRLKHVYNANLNHDPNLPYHDPFYPRFWPERISGELNQRSCTRGVKAKGIFVCDMSDLFGIGIPYWWTKSVLDMILLRTDCRFYLLTKQPQNLPTWSPFPSNCYVGVSVTNQEMFGKAIHYLKMVDAKVKFLSFEPLLDHIIFEKAGISWVILGAQTRPTVMPKIEWVQGIVEACDKAGVGVFLKNTLRPLFTDWILPGWAWWKSNPDHPLSLRQEFP